MVYNQLWKRTFLTDFEAIILSHKGPAPGAFGRAITSSNRLKTTCLASHVAYLWKKEKRKEKITPKRAQRICAQARSPHGKTPNHARKIHTRLKPPVIFVHMLPGVGKYSSTTGCQSCANRQCTKYFTNRGEQRSKTPKRKTHLSARRIVPEDRAWTCWECSVVARKRMEHRVALAALGSESWLKAEGI